MVVLGGGSLIYTLMHKDVEVVDLDVDDDGLIGHVLKPMAPEHMPLGTFHKGMVDRNEMHGWVEGRSIPATRIGISEAMDALGVSGPIPLAFRSFALSLSDQYWVRPAGSDMRWEQVNFFTNEFSEDVGDILFGSSVGGEINLESPDNTSDGNLRKRWKIVDGVRCLIKSGSSPGCQEPFNEVIASRMASLLGIDHVDYRLMSGSDGPCCICPDFIGPETELITADRVMRSSKRKGDESAYTHYVRVCGENGIDVVPALDRMMVLDYLLSNTDRHLNNFGIVRDADTLDWLSSAPLFDNGGSLGYDIYTESMGTDDDRCKPFARTFTEQLGLVTSFDWIDLSVLDDLPDVVTDVLCPENGWSLEARAIAIRDMVSRRADTVRALAGA